MCTHRGRRTPAAHPRSACVSCLGAQRPPPGAAAAGHHPGRERCGADRRRAVRGPARRRSCDVGAVVAVGPASAAAASRPCRALTWSRGRRTGDQIRFEDWRLLKSDFLVVGQVAARSERSGCALRALQRSHRPAAARKGAADDGSRPARDCASRRRPGFERLTGVRGAFATRIAYVAVEGAPPAQRYRLIVPTPTDTTRTTWPNRPSRSCRLPGRPTDSSLAYVSFEGKASAIYVQRPRSGERSRVSARAGINGAPAWSPDGRKLALTLSRDGNLDVYMLDLASQSADPRDRPTMRSTPSPNGRADGGEHLFHLRSRGQRADLPRVRRRGRAAPSASPSRAATTRVRACRRTARSWRWLRWTAATIASRRHEPKTRSAAGAFELDQDESPSYAPNGATLIYGTQDGGRGALATVSSDGRSQQRLSADRGECASRRGRHSPPDDDARAALW